MPPTSKGLGKIVWGIDASEASPRGLAPTSQMLRILSRHTGARILPVYVLTSGNVIDRLRLPADGIQRLAEEAEGKMRAIARQARIPGLLPPRVAIGNAHGPRAAADALGEIAAKEEGNAVAVTTRGHSGVKRALMGSFTEALVLASPIPVLAIGPATPVKRKLDHILYPTDLGTYADRRFEDALELARRIGARVTVFHSAPIPTDIPVRATVLSYKGLGDEVADDWRGSFLDLRKELGAYEARAERAGVRAKAFLDASGLPLATAILGAAKRRKADLIAIPARSRGTTRLLMQTAACPVWILPKTADTGRIGVAA